MVFQRRMTMVATPLPQQLLGAAETLLGCPACDHPKSPTRVRPVMGQSEKIAWAVPLGRRLAGRRFLERNHRRLRWRNAQTTTREPLWQYVHHPAGVRFPFAPDNQVVHEANQQASSLHPRPYFLLEPCIQHMMEAYMAQYGGHDAALHDACLGVRQATFFHHAGPPPLPNAASYTPIVDPFAQSLSQPSPLDTVEVSRHLGIHDPAS